MGYTLGDQDYIKSVIHTSNNVMEHGLLPESANDLGVDKVSLLDWKPARTVIGAKLAAYRMGKKMVTSHHGSIAAKEFDYLEDVKIGWPEKDEVIRGIIETYRSARRWLAL